MGCIISRGCIRISMACIISISMGCIIIIISISSMGIIRTGILICIDGGTSILIRITTITTTTTITITTTITTTTIYAPTTTTITSITITTTTIFAPTTTTITTITVNIRVRKQRITHEQRRNVPTQKLVNPARTQPRQTRGVERNEGIAVRGALWRQEQVDGREAALWDERGLVGPAQC